MFSELVGSNLVVIAHQFNPSILSQLWLVRNGILAEEEFREGCLFSDQIAKIEAADFSLLVVPPQLQFNSKVPAEQQAELVATKVGRIISALPHTPYRGVGLNFHWHIAPEDGDVHALARSLFCSRDRPLSAAFDTEDARFGAYFSKDILGCRLKLDVKPITHQSEEETKEYLLFTFNFHLDIPEQEEEPVEIIARHLQRWGRAKEEATRILEIAAR